MFETHIFIDRLQPHLNNSLPLKFPIEEFPLPFISNPNFKLQEEDDGNIHDFGTTIILKNTRNEEDERN